MKSLQDYIKLFRGIADNLQLTGDSVELLVQMLANATYSSEVEQISYANEASLERSTLMNSKIQHCMNIMYSVYRGTCPRVKIRFYSQKYLTFQRYDKIYSSNNFSIYYDGYFDKTKGDFVYSPITIPPTGDNEEYIITCILASKEIVDTQSLPEYNRYYIDLNYDNLSNDCYVLVNGSNTPVYRKFTDHIKYGGLFDLTLPNYGMRLYAPDIFRGDVSEVESLNNGEELPSSNTSIETHVYEFCQLSQFLDSDLMRISIKGTKLPNNSEGCPAEKYPGLTFIDGSDRDTQETIHYKANRDRYANSIMRSNLDIGSMLEESFPDKIVKGGTNYEFITNEGEKPTLIINYIPYTDSNPISNNEITEFKNSRAAYYVTDDIVIQEGEKVNIFFTLKLELYKNINIDSEVKNILSQYENKFDIDLMELLPEIESSISKITNVRSIVKVYNGTSCESGISFVQLNGDGTTSEYEPGSSKYCSIDYIIESIIYSK